MLIHANKQFQVIKFRECCIFEARVAHHTQRVQNRSVMRRARELFATECYEQVVRLRNPTPSSSSDSSRRALKPELAERYTTLSQAYANLHDWLVPLILASIRLVMSYNNIGSEYR